MRWVTRPSSISEPSQPARRGVSRLLAILMIAVTAGCSASIASGAAETGPVGDPAELVKLQDRTDRLPPTTTRFEGDWLVKETTVGSLTVKLMFYPNPGTAGKYTVDKPLKIYSTPYNRGRTGCRAGYATDLLTRKCWKCPGTHPNRTGDSVNSATACARNGFPFLGPKTRARFDIQHMAASCKMGEYEDLGVCYQCPAGFRMQTLASSSSVEKCVKTYDSARSFDGLYTRGLRDRLFEQPGARRCLDGAKECYIAKISLLTNMRYGYYCGAGYGVSAGDPRRACAPMNALDQLCAFHDGGSWSDRAFGGGLDICANELNFRNSVSLLSQGKLKTASPISEEELHAANAILGDTFLIENLACRAQLSTLEPVEELEKRMNRVFEQTNAFNNCKP